MNEERPRPRRRRETRRGVRVAERIARGLITVGGIGTILAVTGICVFLAWVVVPLFLGASLDGPQVRDAGRDAPAAEAIHLGVDEYGVLSWVLHADGTLRVVRVDTGEELERRPVTEGPRLTAWSFGISAGDVALGFADGSVRLGEISFRSRFVEASDVPQELRELPPGQVARSGETVVVRTPEGQFRFQELWVDIGPPVESGWTTPIRLLDHAQLPRGPVFCALSEADQLAIYGVNTRKNLLTGEETLTARRGELPFVPPGEGAAPVFLGISGSGDVVYLAWDDGRLARFDARDLTAPVLVEELDLVAEAGERLTSLAFLNGKSTLISGDSLGRVRGWFRARMQGAETSDGMELVPAHPLDDVGVPVSALAPSSRSRMVAAGFADGSVRVYYAPTEEQIVSGRGPAAAAVGLLAIAPKENALVALAGGQMWAWDFAPRHPEASLPSLFLPVWYEGFPEPAHVWQSSSGTDDFEPKLGLVPLIFGTLKATFYSMLFGVPLAILAAIYSSEFLDPRLRVGIKSTVEMMASLPSVVLGFLAALVIAPFVQSVLPATLASFLTVPIALLVGAYVWQLLPQRLALRMSGWPRLVAIGLMLPLGVLAATFVGPQLEELLFAGNFELWLDGQRGAAAGGWLFLLLPLCAALTIVLVGRFLDPWVRRVSAEWSRSQCARFDVLRFAGGGLFTLLLALALAWLLQGAGLDPRGGLVDTYVQRNALIVGFVMGFAIIPIIYTLAEDALSSVPSHLRQASLGAGATPWQTAMRVIVPTAMSGLFSAVMIGLGRAVGETMIVLMATGNTPVMSWNVFSGFRTLSANIAVELPEAVRNDTHYRTLFLAALVLFAMTFVLNTGAELVRQRFRERAFQL